MGESAVFPRTIASCASSLDASGSCGRATLSFPSHCRFLLIPHRRPHATGALASAALHPKLRMPPATGRPRLLLPARIGPSSECLRPAIRRRASRCCATNVPSLFFNSIYSGSVRVSFFSSHIYTRQRPCISTGLPSCISRDLGVALTHCLLPVIPKAACFNRTLKHI
jgi:hypothetical protein